MGDGRNLRGGGRGSFCRTGKTTAITPSWVPFPRQVIFLTGAFEFAVSIALVTRTFRYWAGISMAVYAICVWPANFKSCN